MILYSVRNWATTFENNRTRELKRLEWVPVPNRHDGDGFTDLMSRPNGAALYGAWSLILQLASKCEPRGVLARHNPAAGCDNPAPSCGNPAPTCAEVLLPHTAASIGRIVRCPEQTIKEALAACIEIGWLEAKEVPDSSLPQIPHNPAPSCEIPAPACGKVPIEGKGMEGKGTEKKLPTLVGESAHSQFIRRWTESFKEINGFDYAFDGGKDGKAVKDLWRIKPDVSELIQIANDAWRRNKSNPTFHCKQALTIHGFKHNLNQIQGELNGAIKGISTPTSHRQEKAAKEYAEPLLVGKEL